MRRVTGTVPSMAGASVPAAAALSAACAGTYPAMSPAATVPPVVNRNCRRVGSGNSVEESLFDIDLLNLSDLPRALCCRRSYLNSVCGCSDHVEHEARIRKHGDVAGVGLIRDGAHPLGHKALQIGVDGAIVLG